MADGQNGSVEKVLTSDACRVLVSTEPPAWEGLLARHEGATVYHDPAWGQVMARAYNNRCFYLTAWRGGKVVGALMLVLQKSLLFGRHLCSVPYFDAAGLLADDDAARDAILAEVRELRVNCRAKHVELRQLRPLLQDMPTRTDKVTLWLNLPTGAEAMWEQLSTKVRTKVRKCQKSDLTICDGGAELLRDFHAVYSRTMRDLGSPPHSLRFFRLITESLGQAVRLFAVYGKDCPLAASFTLTDRQGFHVPWSGSDWRRRELGANRILYWEMLSWAADAGVKRFDFGRSTRDSGTYEFKREWGAEPVPLYWYYLLPEGRSMPQLRPDSPKYRLLTSCWRRLPVWAARALGPRLIAKLS